MILDKVSLQFDTIESIRESLGSVRDVESSFAPFLLPIIIFTIIIPVSVFLWWAYTRKREDSKYWGNGERIGKVMFRFPKFWIHANVSINKDFSDQNLEELAKINKIKMAPDVIRQLLRDGDLHIYDCKITKYSARSITRVRRRRLRIITSVPIESSDYHSEDERGWRTATNFFDPEKIKNVTVLKFSQRQITNADHNIDNYWTCAILNLTDIEKRVEMLDVFAGKHTAFQLNVKMLNTPQELVKLHDWTVETVEARKRIETLETELQLKSDALDLKSTKLTAKNVKLEKLKLAIEQKMLIGYGKPMEPKVRKSFTAIAGALVFVGGIAYDIWGTIPEFDGISPYMGVVVASAIIAMIFAYSESKEKQKDEIGKIEDDDQ